MRRATNIEHVLCDTRDLLVAIIRGELHPTSAYFNCDDDLVVCVNSGGETYDFIIGVDDPDDEI